MLLDSRDFRVDGFDTCASHGCQTDFTGVAFKSTVDQCVDLAVNITSILRVSESAISGGLLKAVCVLRMDPALEKGVDDIYQHIP